MPRRGIHSAFGVYKKEFIFISFYDTFVAYLLDKPICQVLERARAIGCGLQEPMRLPGPVELHIGASEAKDLQVTRLRTRAEASRS